MANTLRFKRGLASGIPTGVAGEPLFTTDTFDLYIGNGTTNTRFQKYIASGTTSQYLRGDGSLATFPSLTGFVPYTGATANVDLGTHTILAQNATIASSGSGNTATITHSSGSGIALNITKGGNGEGLYINKTSGSGNAATIIGTLNATTLVKSGGLSTEYLKADGSVSTLTNPITGTGTAGQVAYFTGSTTQAGNNNLFWDTTNLRLGIGTTSPSGKLQVKGAVHIERSVAADFSIIDNEGNLNLKAATGGGGGNFNIVLHTAGSERVRLFGATGNFGIGSTTDSGEKLQVTGTMKVTGNAIVGAKFGVGTTTTASAYLNGGAAPNCIQISGSGKSAINFQDTSGTNRYLNIGVDGTSAYIEAIYSTTPDINYKAAIRHIWSTNSAERMRLDGSGNLGLGVTPSAWATGIKAMEFLSKGNSIISGAATQMITTANAFFDSAWKYGTTGFASYYQQINAVHSWHNAPSGTAGNAVTFTQAMTLDASSNLLLGSTTSSGERLQVTGTAKVTGASVRTLVVQTNTDNNLVLTTTNSAADTYSLYENSADANNAWAVGRGNDGIFRINYSTGATYGAGTTTNRIFIDTSGNVAIGNNLILNGTSIEQTNASGLTLNASNASGAILFRTAGSERMSIAANGNLAVDSNVLFVDAVNNEVGIGTNAPNSSLHVVGSITKSIIAKTANYTATVSDYTILCDTTGGGFTITLPASSGITGRIYVIKKTNASSGVGNVTIDGNGSETIDGAATIALQCKSSVMLQCDGSNWHILSLYSDTSCL